jgi:hypothetical protein
MTEFILINWVTYICIHMFICVTVLYLCVTKNLKISGLKWQSFIIALQFLQFEQSSAVNGSSWVHLVLAGMVQQGLQEPWWLDSHHISDVLSEVTEMAWSCLCLFLHMSLVILKFIPSFFTYWINPKGRKWRLWHLLRSQPRSQVLTTFY